MTRNEEESITIDKSNIFCPWKRECGKPNRFSTVFQYEQHHRHCHTDKSMPRFNVISEQDRNHDPTSWSNDQDFYDYIPDDQSDHETYTRSSHNTETEAIIHEATSETTNQNVFQKGTLFHHVGAYPKHILDINNNWKLEPVGVAPKFTCDESIDPNLCRGSMNELERDLAAWRFQNKISGNAYTSLVELINKGLLKAKLSSEEYRTTTTTFDGLKKRVDGEANESIKMPFTNKQISVEDLPDISNDLKEEIATTVDEIHFSYRDIKDLCQLYFRILFSGTERAFLDIDSGEYWEELQVFKQFHLLFFLISGKECNRKINTSMTQIRFPGNVILAVMLASDQTIICGNGRHKAWPLYIKLGNVPMEYRNSDKYHATRVLAYLPTIDCKNGLNPPSWLPAFRVAVFHYCLSLILEPLKQEGPSIQPYLMKGPYNKMYPVVISLFCYIADLPEQRMIAIVKNGQTQYSCPRCLVPTANFHLPCICSNNSNNGLIIRSKYFMQSLYEHGKKMIAEGKSTTQFCKEFSTCIIQNAFWDVPLFDEPCKFLVVDCLHQLGGLYKHLIECTEKMIKDLPDGNSKLKLINKREHQLFPHISNRDYLKILLACVHDFIQQQAVLCLRKFADAFHLATKNFHTESTLKELEITLQEYHKLCPIFESFSPSNMRFPKHHMVWKYKEDIQKFGVVSGYSTCQSEHQHRIDTKAPAKRINFHKYKMTRQMGSYVYFRDLIFDQYWATVTTIPAFKDIMYPSIKPTVTSRHLCSALERGKSMPFSYIEGLEEYNNYPSLIPLIRCCLHTVAKGPDVRCSFGNMPLLVDYNLTLVNRQVITFLQLVIEEYKFKSSEVLKSKVSILMTNTSKEFFMLIQIFKAAHVKPKSTDEYHLPESIDLCLIERYIESNQSHPTRFRVFDGASEARVYERYEIRPVNHIISPVHIMPDFLTAYDNDVVTGSFEQYFENYDTDPTLHTKGTVRGLDESELKTWDITSTNDDIENELESKYDYSDDGYEDEDDGGSFDL
ncbi:hypothetical protein BDA99DRAFT_535897 [Phascolomyces articulosus]|uniref:Transposase domain-containing protein n=1 Tax=Phascolomyces articulosus TaxID=60185 RepID=A0AAD5KCB9_9FUNG|nr:hypothetical protein BDA99DRAFT_535897 [Phascolomyces articulosus]